MVERSTLIGGWLVAHGAAPRSVVASLMNHTSDYICVQIGTGMSGAAFFPLETHFGEGMLAMLLADMPPVAAVAGAGHVARLRKALVEGGMPSPSPPTKPTPPPAAPPLLNLGAAALPASHRPPSSGSRWDVPRAMLRLKLGFSHETLAGVHEQRVEARAPQRVGVPLLDLSSPRWLRVAAAAAERAPPRAKWARADDMDPGMITMTSGTSGRPKGVCTPTRTLKISFVARDRVLPYSGGAEADSDPEVEGANVMYSWEAVRPLYFGQTVAVIPDDVITDTTALVPFLARHRVTRLLTTPSLLATLLDTTEIEMEAQLAEGGAAALTAAAAAASPHGALGSALPTVRAWTLCGEVVPASIQRRLGKLFPTLSLYNSYSSWEGSDATYAALSLHPPPSARVAPAGQLLPGVRCAVLDPSTGEVCGRAPFTEVRLGGLNSWTARALLGRSCHTASSESSSRARL